MGKILCFGDEARKKILVGIDELEKAVVSTLGPMGRTVLINKGTSHPVVTKDGVSVAREIKFSDHYKHLGSSIVKEAAEKANAIAGDGTTTTVLLSSQLCKEGMKLASLGYDVLEIQKGMDAACVDVSKALDKYKKTLADEKDIMSIATISANNDEEVGKVITEAFTGIGDGGIVNLYDSHSKSGKSYVKFSSGLEIPKGIIDGRFITDIKSESFIASNPIIILLNFVPKLNEAIEVFNYALKKSTPIVVIAPEFDEDLEQLIITQVMSKKLTAALIRAPGMSMYSQEEMLKDLAAALGTKVCNDAEELKKLKEEEYGSCESIKSTTLKTSFESCKGSDDDIMKRVEQLEAELAKGKDDAEVGISEEEVKSIQKRIASLTGGVATIYIGALTELRFKELKDRYEDAINAVTAAVSDGIAPGGGLALLKAARDVRELHKEEGTQSFEVGYKALLEVCKKPATRIISSATNDYAYVIADIEHNDKIEYGFDAKKVEICDDMFASGVIDPIKVTKTALQYAASVAGVFLTTDCVITDEAKNISLIPNDPVTERMGDWEF